MAVFVRTGRGLDLSATGFAEMAAAILSQKDAACQIDRKSAHLAVDGHGLVPIGDESASSIAVHDWHLLSRAPILIVERHAANSRYLALTALGGESILTGTTRAGRPPDRGQNRWVPVTPLETRPAGDANPKRG
jgi:hypothetical protein